MPIDSLLYLRYRCHILDPKTLDPVPTGERGVLFVGGIGLARGYLEEEEKTKAIDPFLLGSGTDMIKHHLEEWI